MVYGNILKFGEGAGVVGRHSPDLVSGTDYIYTRFHTIFWNR